MFEAVSSRRQADIVIRVIYATCNTFFLMLAITHFYSSALHTMFLHFFPDTFLIPLLCLLSADFSRITSSVSFLFSLEPYI
jgi:hypothetical protein